MTTPDNNDQSRYIPTVFRLVAASVLFLISISAICAVAALSILTDQSFDSLDIVFILIFIAVFVFACTLIFSASPVSAMVDVLTIWSKFFTGGKREP